MCIRSVKKWTKRPAIQGFDQTKPIFDWTWSTDRLLFQALSSGLAVFYQLYTGAILTASSNCPPKVSITTVDGMSSGLKFSFSSSSDITSERSKDKNVKINVLLKDILKSYCGQANFANNNLQSYFRPFKKLVKMACS